MAQSELHAGNQALSREGAGLRLTPLEGCHRLAGGKLVDFAGWSLPVSFEGLIAEHKWVRSSAGLFDVSHMGEIELRGEAAISLVDQLSCNRIKDLAVGRARYTAFLNDRGGVVDDLIVYRLGEEHLLLCVNASNTEAAFESISNYQSESDSF